MTFYTRTTIGGSEVTDSPNINVCASMSEVSATSTFSADLNNYGGYNTGKYHVNDEVIVYASNDIIRTIGSPVIQFNFNQSGTVVFDSLNFYSGLTYSGASYSSNGKLGSCLSLIGSTSSVCASGINISPQEFTIVCWINKPNRSVHPNNMPFNVKSNTGSSLRCFEGTAGSYEFDCYPGEIGNLQVGGISNSFWNHLAFTYSGNILRGYVNNIEKANTTCNFLPMGSLTSITFGKYAAGTQYFYSGLIDDFRIYDRALTASEISQIYNQGSGTETITNQNQIIFKGILEDKKHKGEGVTESITLNGRDYTARLMDRTIEPEVYNQLPTGSIVKDLISKYSDDITYSGVQVEAGSIKRIVYSQTPLYDGIKQLADMKNFMFYVTPDKDLYYGPFVGSSSGYGFNNTNVIKGDFKEQRDTVFNQIWVYGDKYLDGFRETFTAGSPVGGSLFTLYYKPHNVSITVSGAVIQPGGIAAMNFTPGSNIRYLVDFDNKQIIFTSGTICGTNIPASGNAVIITYDRDLPIIKVGDNEASKSQYGQRNKVIVDKNIKDPQTAQDILTSEINKYGIPALEGNLLIDGVVSVTPGQTCDVNLPNHGISGTYSVIEASYDINKENNLREHICTLKLNRKLPDLTDKIKQIMLDIKKLQGADMVDTDVLPRYLKTSGSIGIRQSGCVVYERNITGSAMIWGNPLYATWGTDKWGTAGSAFSSWEIVWSGGYV